MYSKRLRLQRVDAPRHDSSASAAQPAIFSNVMTDSVNEMAPEQIWTIRPSHQQPSATEFELTHSRRMPLPFAIDLVIGGKTYGCVYGGHGKNKVVYRVIDEPQVLKLSATEDQEPYVCKQLSLRCSAEKPALKICPTVYDIARCQEQDTCGKPMREWFAWLAEYATPLDKYMQRLNVNRVDCLKIALYKQVIVAQLGLLLSDNNLFNFGVVDNTVVIIDTGSRCLQQHAILKSTMNSSAIQKWWHKLNWQCTRGEFEECRVIWQRNTSLDEVAQELCNTRLRPLCTGPLIHSVEQPVVAISQAPSVWDLLEEPQANDALQWLLDKCLFGKLACLKLLRTGKTIPLEQEEEQPAHIRLETLIKLTEQRRSNWIQKPNDILSEEILKDLLDEWKADYKAWMMQSAQDEWYRIQHAKRHEFERTRFRTFLFKMCGCYELVIFWLRVQASWTSLNIFHDVFSEERTGVREETAKDKINRAVAAVMDAEVLNSTSEAACSE